MKNNDKQKDRLVELLEQATSETGKYFRETTKKVLAEKGRFNSATDIDRRNIYEVESDYLLANGVIVPPCKVGDTAYFLIEDTVAGKKYISPEPIVDVCTKGFYTSGHADSDENGDLWLWSDVGRIVYFTKEEAEKALKEGVQG